MKTWAFVMEKVRELNNEINVSNLSYGASEDPVRGLFEKYGAVTSISWVADRGRGRFEVSLSLNW